MAISTPPRTREIRDDDPRGRRAEHRDLWRVAAVEDLVDPRAGTHLAALGVADGGFALVDYPLRVSRHK